MVLGQWLCDECISLSNKKQATGNKRTLLAHCIQPSPHVSENRALEIKTLLPPGSPFSTAHHTKAQLHFSPTNR